MGSADQDSPSWEEMQRQVYNGGVSIGLGLLIMGKWKYVLRGWGVR